MIRNTSRILLATGLALSALTASAQTFPTKPIRVMTTATGSAGDFTLRVIGPALLAALGQPIVVDNRGGIAAEVGAKAPPDGYTLVYYGSPLWLAPYLHKNVAYEPLRDFAPISVTTSSPLVLVVHPSVPAKSVKELVALAKAKPGELNWGSGIAGGSPHLAGALFMSMAGINTVHVPYKGSGQALNALVGNEVQMAFAAAGTLAPHMKSGRVRGLAVTSAEPSELVPGLPTIAAAGLPGYEAASLYGLVAPAKTAPAVIARLNQEFVRALNRPEAKEKLFGVGIEVIAGSPQQATAVMKGEMARMGKVIRDAGVRG